MDWLFCRITTIALMLASFATTGECISFFLSILYRVDMYITRVYVLSTLFYTFSALFALAALESTYTYIHTLYGR